MTAKSSIVSCNNTYFYTHTVFLSFLMWNVGTFCDWRMSNEWSLFSQKNTWWLAQKGTDRKKHGDDNESPVVLLRMYTRSATRRQTVMVDINLLLSHFPRFLVCFATMAAELWRIGPNPDISPAIYPLLFEATKLIGLSQAWHWLSQVWHWLSQAWYWLPQAWHWLSQAWYWLSQAWH